MEAVRSRGRKGDLGKDAKIQIQLIGNYAADRQQSMERFAGLLCQGLRAAGYDVGVLRPPSFLGARVRNPFRAPGKWLAYVDKYIISPIWFRAQIRKLNSKTIFHICDHSNAVYRNVFEGRALVVTCHDILAVRGAFGDESVHCPASPTGRLLQRWILRELSGIDAVGCDSAATLADLARLALPNSRRVLRVIYPPVNPAFRRVERKAAADAVAAYTNKTPYVLHVGSNLARKNREGVLRIFRALMAKGWDGCVAVAGEKLSRSMWQLAAELGVRDRVIDIGPVDHETLNALYSAAVALIFPSYSEGFGWPVLEAQASGCPVICTNTTSVPEIAGTAALQFDPDDVEGMAAAVLLFTDEATRSRYVEEGLVNMRRFTVEQFVAGYLDLYREILDQSIKER